MGDGDLIPITNQHGRTVWVTQPPERCTNGHPWAPPGRGYAEGWFSCWCDGAQAREARPGHSRYECKQCRAVTLVPPCTDPTLKVGWAAHHGH
jgi:hypothetical protein